MIKKILIVLVALIVLLVGIESIALIHLKKSIDNYASYWSQQNKTAQGSFTYVALGDSTAQAIGTSNPQNGYVGLLAQRIRQQTGQKVRLINLSVSGARIQDVLDKQLAELKNYKPDLVTIEIGANNVTAYNASQFKTQFDLLASQLPKNTYVATMPYFGGRVRDNKQALAASSLIQAAVQSNNLHLVNLQQITRERQSIHDYSADLFHPSTHGYINWADAFWQVIQPDLGIA
jgi:acyl-CoA thioesterase-1